LIKKGVLTDQEGEEVRADIMHDFSQTEIATESSTTGIATLIDNTAQIGMSSRRAKPTEMSAASAKGITFRPTIVAFDAMSIIVNQAMA
jgi:phosphate transport system substrate-binding protein